MNTSKQVMIDTEAAEALVEWESVFGTEVCEQAKRLAAERGHRYRVTLSEYRSAARIALEALLRTIDGETRSNAQHEAA